MSSADRNALRLTIFIGDTDLWQDRAFLPQLDPLIGEGQVVLDEVEVIRYIGRASIGSRKERR